MTGCPAERASDLLSEEHGASARADVAIRGAHVAEESSSPEPSMSRQVAARDSTRALTWIGVLALVYSAVNTIMPPATVLAILVGDVILGVTLIAVGLWLTRHRSSPGRVAWLFGGAIATVGIWGSGRMWRTRRLCTCCT